MAPVKTPLIGSLALAAALAVPGAARAQLDARAVPTYESVGLYWSNPGRERGDRLRGEVPQGGRHGLDARASPLWFDARDDECRGSLVHLAPDTEYQAELNLAGPVAPTRGARSSGPGPTSCRWRGPSPVASGVGHAQHHRGRHAAGYVVYEGAPGAVLDAQNAAAYNVTINASYVIVRGLTCAARSRTRSASRPR